MIFLKIGMRSELEGVLVLPGVAAAKTAASIH